MNGGAIQELFISEAQEKTLNRPALARLWEAYAAQARETARAQWQRTQRTSAFEEPLSGGKNAVDEPPNTRPEA
jgi:hypothetical protein